MKRKNDLLCKAFEDADIEYFDCVIKQTDVEWNPSEDFERKMHDLIHKPKRSYKSWQNTCKWVACIVLVFTILSSAIVNVEAIRSPFVEFFLKIYEKFSDVFVENEGAAYVPRRIETSYLPTLIPDGYQIDYQGEEVARKITTYTNENNLQIRFSQETLNNTHFRFDTEGAGLQEIVIKSYRGQYFVNKGSIIISWIAHDYAFCLSVPDCFTVEEAVQIAESLSPIE